MHPGVHLWLFPAVDPPPDGPHPASAPLAVDDRVEEENAVVHDVRRGLRRLGQKSGPSQAELAGPRGTALNQAEKPGEEVDGPRRNPSKLVGPPPVEPGSRTA
eukprot:5733279-Alexandrium_andersonii.AAC.1